MLNYIKHRAGSVHAKWEGRRGERQEGEMKGGKGRGAQQGDTQRGREEGREGKEEDEQRDGEGWGEWMCNST